MDRITSLALNSAMVFSLFLSPTVLQTAEAAGCHTLSRSTLKDKASPYKSTINHAASNYGVNPDLVTAVITIESCFKQRARGTSGETGLMQLMPGTARLFGVRRGYNPTENILGGTRYLSYLLGHYQGNHERAIAAYNAGQGNIKKSGRIPNIGYVRKVMKAYRKLAYGKAPTYQSGKRYHLAHITSSRQLDDDNDTNTRVNQSSSNKTKLKRSKKQRHMAVASINTTRSQNDARTSHVTKAAPAHQTQQRYAYKGTSKRNTAKHYQVRSGDTLYAAMRSTGIPVHRIIHLNQLRAPYTLRPGQELRVN